MDPEDVQTDDRKGTARSIDIQKVGINRNLIKKTQQMINSNYL